MSKQKTFLFLLLGSILLPSVVHSQTRDRIYRSSEDSVLISKIKALEQQLKDLQQSYDNEKRDRYSDASAGTNILEYDFQLKQFIYKDKPVRNINRLKVKHDELFRVKVTHINRYLYNIAFSADDIAFGSEPPALFNQFFTGTEGSFNDLLSKLESSTDGDTSAMLDSMAISPDEKEIFETKLGHFVKTYYTLLEDQLQAYTYCYEEMTSCRDKTYTKGLLLDFYELKAAYNTYNERLTVKIAAHEKEIEALEEKVKDCKKNCEGLKKNLATLKENKAALQSHQAALKSTWDNFSTISTQELMKLSLFANNFVADHYSYVSPPIYPKGNRLNIGLKIRPSDSSLVKKWNIMPLYDDSLDLNLFVKYKWFVSFSSGPFVALGNSLRHEIYDWQPQPNGAGVISDSAQYKLVANGYDNVPIGLSAFANLGIKLTRGLGVALSPGVGLTLEEKPRPVYFLGASLLLGEEQQFNITGGLALAQTEKLRSERYPNMANTLYDSPPSDIAYRKTLNAGFFLSISYTVFSLDKTRNGQSASRK